MNENSFGAMLSFAGMFLLMAFDYKLGNIAFLIPLIILLIFGSYCSIRWIVEKRKIEIAEKVKVQMRKISKRLNDEINQRIIDACAKDTSHISNLAMNCNIQQIRYQLDFK